MLESTLQEIRRPAALRREGRVIAAHHSLLRAGGASSRDYVQDAAFLFFDGVENVGRGQHSSAATVWANLANENAPAVATSGLLGEWLADAFRFNQDGGFACALSNVNWPAGGITIETAFRISQFGTWAGRPFGSYHGTSGAWKRLCFYPRNASGGGADVVWGADVATTVQLEGGDHLPKNYTVAIVGSTTATGFQFRWNCSTTSFSTSYYPRDKATNITIGNEGDLARPLLGDVCAVRFHARQLTAAEIDFNAALDRKRFGVT